MTACAVEEPAAKRLSSALLSVKMKYGLAVTQDTTAHTLEKVITDNVTPGSTVMTDEYRPYNHVTRLGYDHHRVNHSSKEFVVGQKSYQYY